jgi:hypothetical protein
MANQL